MIMKSQTLAAATLLLLVLQISQGKIPKTPPKLIAVPQLYFSSVVTQCSNDSPEYYYEVVGFPNLNALFDEGKVFFGVLMDKLETSVSNPKEKEKVEKEWKSLAEVVTKSLELAAQRIDDYWVKIIDDFDTKSLPWELSWRKAILVEQFLRLHYEYQILEAVLKSGVKEIVASLQTQLMDVIKKLENKLGNKNEDMTEQKILTSMEKNLKKLEPNFMGKLLTAIVQRALNKKNSKETFPAITTYVAETIDKITLTIEAYKDKGNDFPLFWTQMTQIMKNEGSRKAMSIPDLLTIYGDEELVIQNVISLLHKPKGQTS